MFRAADDIQKSDASLRDLLLIGENLYKYYILVSPLLPSTTTQRSTFHVCIFAAHTASGTSNTLYTSFYRYKSASPRAKRVYSSNSNASARGVVSDQHQRYDYAIGAPLRRTRWGALPRRVTKKRQRRVGDGYVVATISKPRRGRCTTRSMVVDLVLLHLPCVAARPRESFAFHRHQ